MSEFNKQAFCAGLNELADTGTDRWDEIRQGLEAPSAGAARQSRRLPLRVAAVACCAVLLTVAGLILGQGGLIVTENDSAAPQAGASNGNGWKENSGVLLDQETEDSSDPADSNGSSGSLAGTHTALDLLIAAEATAGTESVRLALQTGLNALETGAVSVRTAAVRYTDTAESLPFAEGTAHTAAFLQQAADPGGTPALIQALTDAVQAHVWREEAAKVLVLAADRIPADTGALRQAVNDAAAQGIRFVPVITDTADAGQKQLLASLAQETGGACLVLAQDGEAPEKALADVLREILN